MKQAILLMIHKDVEQTKKIINYFQGKCDIFINVDKSSSITKEQIKELKTMPGVVEIYKKYKIHWGGFSILKAELYMLKRAIMLSNFNYVHLLSGQDYPIKPLSVFLRKFENSNEDYIACSHLPNPDTDGNTYRRLLFYFFLDWLKPETEEEIEKMWELSRKQEKWGIRRNIFKPFLHLYCGSAWFSLTRNSITALLNYTKKEPRFYRKMRFTFVPEEIYINTVLINLNYSGQNLNNCNLRYIKWPKNGANHPITLKEEHLQDLSTSDAFFARKIDKNESSILINEIDKYLLSEEIPVFHNCGIREQKNLSNYNFDCGLASEIIKTCNLLNIKTSIDLGCGPGFYVSTLRKAGIIVHGFDGNPHIEEQSKCILHEDSTTCKQIYIHKEIKIDHQTELVLFLNVGEYIPKEYENTVFKNICNITKKFLIISWQSNIDFSKQNHVVNSMPNDILEQKLEIHGFKKDIMATQRLKEASSMSINKRNVMLFKRIYGPCSKVCKHN